MDIFRYAILISKRDTLWSRPRELSGSKGVYKWMSSQPLKVMDSKFLAIL